MTHPFNPEGDQLYIETLAWLTAHLPLEGHKPSADVLADALESCAEQLVNSPPTPQANIQFAFYQTLHIHTPAQNLPWSNFEIFIHEQLHKADADHEKILCRMKTANWQSITEALLAFAKTKG